MPARSLIDHVAMTPEGDIRAHKTVTITKTDGSAFDGTLYDAVSGGSVVVAPETNSAGLLKLWTDPEATQRVKVTVEGDAGPTDSDFRFDPADLFYDTMTAARSLAGGLTITKNANDYALSVRNTDTNSKAFRLYDSVGAERVTYKRNTSNGNSCFIVAHDASGAVPLASQMLVYAASPTTYVNADFQLDASGGSGADSGAMRAFAFQQSGGSLIRAGEFQVSRYTTATAAGVYGIEVGVHNGKAHASPDAVVGLRVYSTDGFGVAGGVPADTGLYMDGSRGWNDFIRCYSNGGLLGFRVASGLLAGDQLGDVIVAGRFYSQELGATYRVGLVNTAGVTAGDTWAGFMLDTAVNAVALRLSAAKGGVGAYPVSLSPDGGRVAVGLSSAALAALANVPSTTLHVVGSVGSADGAAGGPGLTFTSDTDTGIFLQAANSLGLTTGGTERLRIGSDGLLDYRTSGVSTGPGGGAPASFTTVGGSGPTTAVQAGWTKIKTGGTVIWIPHWQ